MAPDDFDSMADTIWQGKGEAANQKIRVLGWCRDGVRVRFERIAGAPEHALHSEHRVPVANIFTAFEPANQGGGAMKAKLRKIEPCPDLYPDLDFERINQRAKELREFPTDAQAIAHVLRRDNQGGDDGR